MDVTLRGAADLEPGSWRRRTGSSPTSSAAARRSAGWTRRRWETYLLWRLRWWRPAGIEVLTLDARGDNDTALHIYRALGFTEYGRLRDFVAVGERRYDKVLYALDLRRA